MILSDKHSRNAHNGQSRIENITFLQSLFKSKTPRKTPKNILAYIKYLSCKGCGKNEIQANRKITKVFLIYP